jgi:hypothetical protein
MAESKAEPTPTRNQETLGNVLPRFVKLVNMFMALKSHLDLLIATRSDARQKILGGFSTLAVLVSLQPSSPVFET